MVKVLTAKICSAMLPGPVGSMVQERAKFYRVLDEAVAGFDFSACRVPGQGFLPLEAAVPFVSSGEGLRTTDVGDYIVRLHRGEVAMFLRRQFAAPCTSCNVVVYTAAAYLSDPEVASDPAEVERVTTNGATHVLVAVLAGSGPQAPLTPDRLVKNLAGGNKEAAEWSYDEIVAKARETADHWSRWCVVAG